jgi:TIR domain
MAGLTSGDTGTDASIKLFICYRRADAQDAAGRLASELIRHVPLTEDEVFVDIESLTVGQPWKDEIHDVIVSRDVLIAVISPSWTIPDKTGRLRIKRTNDPVRVELETAVEAGVPIFPVLVGGARVPREAELPPTLKVLPSLHAVELRHEHYSGDLGRLVTALKKLPRRPPPRPAGPVGRQRTASPAGTPPAGTPPAPARGIMSPLVRPAGGLVSPVFRPIGQWTREERDEWFAEARRKAALEEERKARLRAAAPTFYSSAAWWVAVAVTLVACAAAVVTTELVFGWVVGLLFDLGPTDAPLVAVVVLTLVWTLAYVALATVSYVDDPGDGASIFYRRGILVGWSLLFDGMEEGAGLAGAYPVNLAFGWAVARGAALGVDTAIGVDQIGWFVLILAVVTVVSLVKFVLGALDEL